MREKYTSWNIMISILSLVIIFRVVCVFILAFKSYLLIIALCSFNRVQLCNPIRALNWINQTLFISPGYTTCVTCVTDAQIKISQRDVYMYNQKAFYNLSFNFVIFRKCENMNLKMNLWLLYLFVLIEVNTLTFKME